MRYGNHISRVLGSDGYGKYSFSYSVTNYFILLAALGIYTYAIREGAKIRDDQKAINQFCSQVFSINVCSAAISLLLLFAMVLFLPKFSGYKAYIFIQSTAIVMAVIGTDWVNGIFEDYFYITVRYIAVQCICLLAMFVFVRRPEDIIPYCIISVLATNGGNLIKIKTGRNGELTKELWIDRRESSKSLTWSSILLAFEKTKGKPLVERPKALGDIRGVSYIYGMFSRFGLIEVPVKQDKLRSNPAS